LTDKDLTIDTDFSFIDDADFSALDMQADFSALDRALGEARPEMDALLEEASKLEADFSDLEAALKNADSLFIGGC